MNKKKVVAVLATVAIVATLFTGCGKNGASEAPKPAEGEKPAAEQMMVGLVTDEGGVNDKSFNQAADEGIKKAKSEFEFEYKPIESQKKEEYEPNMDTLIEDGAKLTFAVGFQMEDAVKNVSARHKDKNLVFIDGVVNAPNVESIVFKANEGSFLMGIIAGKMTKTNKIGFIGGKDFQPINEFEVGFAAGVKAVNPKAAEGLISPDGKAAGKTVKYTGTFGDVGKGKEAAIALYGDGCDIVYHAAGGCGIGLFQAAKENGKVWAIGVDKDQGAELEKDFGSVILTSMMKRVDSATYTACKDLKAGNIKGGTVLNLGLAEEGVAVAPSSKKNTPAEVLAEAETFKKKIIAKEIKVPVNRQEAKDFK